MFTFLSSRLTLSTFTRFSAKRRFASLIMSDGDKLRIDSKYPLGKSGVYEIPVLGYGVGFFEFF